MIWVLGWKYGMVCLGRYGWCIWSIKMVGKTFGLSRLDLTSSFWEMRWGADAGELIGVADVIIGAGGRGIFTTSCHGKWGSLEVVLSIFYFIVLCCFDSTLIWFSLSCLHDVVHSPVTLVTIVILFLLTSVMGTKMNWLITGVLFLVSLSWMNAALCIT